ncbi:MAG: hypothetical protein A3C84_05025 [Candidatus Ryanbacteria bacterium RIFCSPHIGHO2_02_FULL_48_12]|uniref:DOD-type homing endonuclease domain-containing protein n=1 Tax=Candidatus Ryanbacteria bacterium RIFCSPHIGHO2_01_FULL_48_27 TaxID=1802115 RepID=A0A1G2G7D1_9BACT|nr:MAG: hypothetical protein A2756_06100 [Candidatus Ryanbacteria bacterium RIFCSPHIGHO2_01_FULL_48_27]OGZ49526.1 MAG: hypothetical protein A3C84_05025 [Candidatus Ryanbacteria bacterium RIFCSPHIGHO2_02_FULL_48_12]
MKWSPGFAYALGLLASDGSLSKDGRHIDLTSKNRDQLETFLSCLHLNNVIGVKASGKNKISYRVQFGDVLFYNFLLSTGFMPAKSKILGELKIPKRYFFDFLRGSFDGDGTFYSYHDPRWKSSFMFYTVFVTASPTHLKWLRESISYRLGIRGHITHDKRRTTYQLKYAKSESIKLLEKLYESKSAPHLKRKYLKVQKALRIVGASI